MSVIAVGGFQHETNTFAPSKADYAAFEQGGGWPPLTFGEAIAPRLAARAHRFMPSSLLPSQFAALQEPTDALVVDIPRPGTEGWMPLFVVLREGAELDGELTKEIARRVRSHCSPRHVPDEVFQIAEVPRTLSGKVLEVPVKRILTGTPPEQAASRDSLANPRSLDYFVELAAFDEFHAEVA